MNLKNVTKKLTIVAVAAGVMVGASVPIAAVAAASLPLGAKSCSSPRAVQTHSYSNGSPKHEQYVGATVYPQIFPLSYTTLYHRYSNKGLTSVTNSKVSTVENNDPTLTGDVSCVS